MNLSKRFAPRDSFIVASLLLLFIASFLKALDGFDFDIQIFRSWANHLGKHGLRNAYSSGTNYLPIYQYVLWLYAKIAGSEENIAQYINYLRIVPLLVDYWALYLVFKWIDKRVDYLLILLCSILNIAYSYNSIIWGQIDAIHSGFLLAAFYYLDRGLPLRAVVFALLAINTKLQSIVLLPLFGLLLIAHLHRERRWKDVPSIVAVVIVVQSLILLPFAIGKVSLSAIWQVAVGSVGMLPTVTANACNVWYLALPSVDGLRDSQEIISGLSYRMAGLLAFCFASLAILWPVLLNTVRTLKNRSHPPLSKQSLWLSAALLTLAFYYFCTQMHERYAHPSFIFITALSFYRKQFGLYALFSIAYLLSLDRVALWVEFGQIHPVLSSPTAISVMFGICILWAGILLVRATKISTSANQHLERRGLNLKQARE